MFIICAMKTIATLRLNVKEAEAGKTWLLLPEGYRAQDLGKKYPLPTRYADILKLSNIWTPGNKKDSGCIYLRRVRKRFKELQSRKQCEEIAAKRRKHAAVQNHSRYNIELRKMKAQARAAVDEVRETAKEAIASLTDLFSLGRKGLDGMMRAHLSGETWQGEQVDGAAFRQCFRMVTQAVKGLGLPSDQRSKARETVMEEVAASIAATREAVALGSGTEEVGSDEDTETEH